jgi:hypothetical protein
LALRRTRWRTIVSRILPPTWFELRFLFTFQSSYCPLAAARAAIAEELLTKPDKKGKKEKKEKKEKKGKKEKRQEKEIISY